MFVQSMNRGNEKGNDNKQFKATASTQGGAVSRVRSSCPTGFPISAVQRGSTKKPLDPGLSRILNLLFMKYDFTNVTRNFR
jgi:hypothetical protein